MNKISAGNMVRKMSCVILFFSIILPAVGEAPYQKVTSHGLDIYFHFDMGSFIWQDIEKRDLDLAKMAPGFADPVLILHGRQDPLGESVPQQLSRYYGNAKLVFIEKCGHYSWIEQPDEVFSAIKNFLAEDDFPALSGPYLGQKPPGMTPEVFAPGVVSRDGIQMKLTMTADGSEILYTERDPATNAVSFIIRRRTGDSWSEPVVLPYSREYMEIEPSLSPDGKTDPLRLQQARRAAKASRKKCPTSGWRKNPEINGESRPFRPSDLDGRSRRHRSPSRLLARTADLLHAAKRKDPPSLPGRAPRRRIRRTGRPPPQGRFACGTVQRAVPFPRRPDPSDALAKRRRLRKLGPLRCVQGRIERLERVQKPRPCRQYRQAGVPAPRFRPTADPFSSPATPTSSGSRRKFIEKLK